MKRFPTYARTALVLSTLVLGGCYAGVRGTVKLVEADQELAKARAAGAQSHATYEWTMADEYMKKARDEWARSDFQSAEQLTKKAKKWAADAATVARTSAPIEHIDDLDVVPARKPAKDKDKDKDKDKTEDVWDEEEGVW